MRVGLLCKVVVFSMSIGMGISIALLNVGCGSQLKAHKKRALMHPNAALRSQDFNNGYGQGCGSGRNAVGDVDYSFSKDGVNYTGNREYRAGWDEGYAMCQEEYLTEVQNRVKQNTDFNVHDNEDSDLRHKIWEELRK